ncbi:MAG: MmcQ-like protein [Bacteroidetes bacterium]|nr:MmcQ-like protein [Bacteroidota bacterium]
MNVEDIRNYCLSLKGAEECFPFDDETLVFKALGKMFAFIPLEEPDLFINLKCDPVKALNLREKYQAVQPGYHMNKKYWNTVALTNEVTEKLLKEWIKHSYHEVMKGIPKKKRECYV